MVQSRRRAALSEDRLAAQRTTLGPVRRGRLTDDVAARLVAGIVDGKFKLGERLPAERDLARYLDVGRPTLREAIVTLRAVGLLEVRHGEGTFVVARQRDFLVKALSWVVLLDARGASELHEARLALESAILDLAAERATDADVADLDHRLRQLAASTGQPRRFAAADAAFEQSLARATRNEVLARLVEALRLLVDGSAERDAPLAERLERRRAQLAALAGGRCPPNGSARGSPEG